MLSYGLVLLTEEASVLQLLLREENFGCLGCLGIKSKEAVIIWVNCFSNLVCLGGGAVERLRSLGLKASIMELVPNTHLYINKVLY
jgi:hypothetical protein